MYILLFEKNLCGKPEYTCILWGVQVQKSKINQLFASTLVPTDIMKCVIPENTHTSPTEGIFSKNSHPPSQPSGNSNKASYIYLNFLALQNPHPPGNSNHLCGGEYGYFLELHNSTRQKLHCYFFLIVFDKGGCLHSAVGLREIWSVH